MPMLKDLSGPSNPLTGERNVLQAKPILKSERKGKGLASVSAEGTKNAHHPTNLWCLSKTLVGTSGLTLRVPKA